MEFIKLQDHIEHEYRPRRLIKSLLRNENGEPILRSDLIEKVSDENLKTQLESITDKEEVKRMPEIGQPMEENVLYKYYNPDTEESYLIKCRQAHNRTIYDPDDIPALFSFYRENSDDLLWIPNELVKPGWKRWYDGVQYEQIQASEILTLVGQTPDVTPALWSKVSDEEIIDWYQPTGAYDAFRLGDLVRYTDNKVYESKIDYNTYSPEAYPAGWEFREDLS
jgi:hypothetical protein